MAPIKFVVLCCAALAFAGAAYAESKFKYAPKPSFAPKTAAGMAAKARVFSNGNAQVGSTNGEVQPGGNVVTKGNCTAVLNYNAGSSRSVQIASVNRLVFKGCD